MNFAVAKARAIRDQLDASRDFDLANTPRLADPAAHRELAYPSMVVELRIRFDETLLANDSELADPSSADGSGRSFRKLIGKTGDANRTFIRHIVPLTCDLSISRPREAGTFNLKILFDEFPLDPRPLAAVGVRIWVDTLTPDEFSRGMSGAWSQGERPSILTRLTEDNLRFVGYADDIDADYPMSGPSTITIAGRDPRGLLLDAPFPVHRYAEIDLTQPIDVVVQQILLIDKLGKEIAKSVQVQPQEWPDHKVPSPAGDTNGSRVNRGPANSKPHIPAPSESPNYWDLITHYCTLVGAVPYFRGSHLRIRPGRSLHDERSKGMFDPVLDVPFRTRSGAPAVRQDSGGNAYSVRRYIYGDNVGSVKFKKKFGGVKVPTIRVFSLDTNSTKRGAKRAVVAEWPEKDSKARGKQSASGEKSEGEPMVVPVAGLTSAAQALEIAKDLYNEIGRQEITGEYEATNLSSLGGDGTDPDNLRINPGDPVEFFAATSGFGARSPLLAGITDSRSSTFGEAVKAVTDAMERAGWEVDENLARVVVATARGAIAKMLNVFRVTGVTIRWDGSGKKISVSFTFDNFLTSHFAVTPSNGPVTKPPSVTRSRKERQRKTPGHSADHRAVPEPTQRGVDGFGGAPMDSTPSSRGDIPPRTRRGRPL